MIVYNTCIVCINISRIGKGDTSDALHSEVMGRGNTGSYYDS